MIFSSNVLGPISRVTKCVIVVDLSGIHFKACNKLLLMLHVLTCKQELCQNISFDMNSICFEYPCVCGMGFNTSGIIVISLSIRSAISIHIISE